MSRYYDFYPPYVSVAEKRRRNAKMAEKLAKQNKSLKPIVLSGRTIASTFWGKAWCDNIESYQDYAYRLERGRSYVRSGAVLDLQITEGHVSALVAGSDRNPYKIEIDIKALPPQKWEALKKKCVGKISSLLALIQGKLPAEILKEFCSKETGLFPSPQEIQKSCSCPDYASLCKHIAAVLYGIGARLDEEPALFFTLRKIDGNELIGAEAASSLTAGVESEIAAEKLEDVFGVSFDELPDSMPDVTKTKAKPEQKAESKINSMSGVTETKAKPEQKVEPKTTRETASAAKAVKTVRAGTKWTKTKLVRLRKELKLSPADVARHLGVCTQTIVNWEKGKNEIKSKYNEKLNQLAEGR